MNILKNLFYTAGLYLLFAATSFGQSWELSTNAKDNADAFEETTSAIEQVFNLVFWLMYGVGTVMMGISGFKLKQGDVPGFAKMFLGGGALFISPLVIQSLQTLGGQ